MPEEQIQQIQNQVNSLQLELAEFKREHERSILEHVHDGNQSSQVKHHDLFGEAIASVPLDVATIATTGNTDGFIIAPFSGRVTAVEFSSSDALATSDVNYLTFSVTNLGQSGSGADDIVQGVDANTTKATGGSAISANTRRELTLKTSVQNTGAVAKGDRIRVRAAATGTLANTLTKSVYIIRFE